MQTYCLKEWNMILLKNKVRELCMEKIKRLYMGEFKFFKREISKIFIILMVLFLVISIATGVVVYNNEELAENLFEYITNLFEQLDINDEPGILMSKDIFLNNVQSSAVVVFLGFIPFLFLPITSVILNSVVLGGAVGVYSMLGVPIKISMLGIMPHGIFEIPAVMYAVSLGIYLNICIFRKIIQSKKKDIIWGKY